MLAYIDLQIETTTHGQAALAVLLLVIALGAFVSLPAILRRLTGRRGGDLVHGVCGHCGYSLRGLPTTICPECGSNTAIVGTRQPSRNPGAGRWFACASWIALLLVFNSNFRWDIDTYLLRLIWGIKYVHTRAVRPVDEIRAAELFRQLLIAALTVAGVIAILFTSRKSRWR